ncbi:MAG: glycosyltransferase [Ktedonobacteraceae bacterium]|nr:glycosyltransferase [Chloroflexota bacterium]
MKRPNLAEEPTRGLDQVVITDARAMRLQVARYAEWLSAQTRRHTAFSAVQEMNEYAASAGKVTLVGNRKVEIFAPFRPEHSALQTITTWQTVTLIALVALWCVGLNFFRLQVLVGTMAVITFFYLFHLLLTIVLSLFTFRRSAEEHIDEAIVYALQSADWPHYTILCPLYREARVVPQFVRAMRALDYPPEKLQILFLTEADDAETRNAIRALHLPPHFKIVTVPDGQPRTKPRACNYGLMQASGQYVVIYDAEDVPEPMQLKKAVLTFANHGPNLACVQAKLNFYNPEQNLLTRWFTSEYSLWFDLILPGLQQAGLSIPLGGTSNHFPTRILRALGGWDAFNVTEDCDLGLRLARYRLDTVVLNSTTYEEANSRPKNWIRQRSRWIKGYMQTYLVSMRHPFRYLRPGHMREFISLQLVIGGKTAFLFLNPMLWLLFLLYIIFRPFVEAPYQSLFPKPLLYASTFTLVFGNFFYIYIYLLACLRRRQYRLIKWTLLVPVYWVMMSIAACMGGFQLIVKPHYWEKTEHGLHLGKKQAQPLPDFATLDATFAVMDEPTVQVPVAGYLRQQIEQQSSSITAAFRSIATLPIPAFTRRERVQLDQATRTHRKNPWLVATLLIAAIASIASCWYVFQQHQILLYGDAYSHMMLARRFFDSTTPGFAQLGGVWLPLPHLLMLPFIWNDYLWRSGLAGSFASMICYLFACGYLFLAAQRLTNNNLASFIGTLAFMANPNILYLQSTPLSELACIATSTMACYYFLCWSQDNLPKQLVWAAAGTFLATLARYDGWALFVALLIFVLLVSLLRRQRWAQIQGNLFVFGTLGGLGIVLWLFWNLVIFHDILYFQRGPYSAQGQGVDITTHETYHNLYEAIRYYGFNIVEVCGPILVILSLLAFIVILFRLRISPVMLAVLAFLVPVGFYVLSLYTGQVGVFVPGAEPASDPRVLFNVRFGCEVAAASGLLLAFLASWMQQILPRILGMLGQVLVVVAVVAQIFFLTTGGVVTLQDGQFGGSCAFPHLISLYLAQHYTGGRILENTFTSNVDGVDAGVQLKDIVYDGSADLWTQALRDPASVVDWIIMDPKNPRDIVTQHINTNSLQFQQQFTLVYQEQFGLRLYHRNGLPPLPTRQVPVSAMIDLNEHSQCIINQKHPQSASAGGTAFLTLF